MGFDLTLDESVRRRVVGDPVRLRQILTNLLSNAVKFTSEGSIGLSVAKAARGDRYYFEVRDSGIGFEPDVIALTGLAHDDRTMEMQPAAINQKMVYGNKVIFGSVNAARRHYDQAADALAQADPAWLAQLITRRVRPKEWPLALKKRPNDIKIVIDMAGLA